MTNGIDESFMEAQFNPVEPLLSVTVTSVHDAPESAGASVSRADVAEVVVRSLLDPRACNLACTLSDSAYAGEIAGQEDVSKLLEPLRPNYL